MKRTLSWLLVLSMMLSAVGMTAGAEGTEDKRIIDDGAFADTAIGEGIIEVEVPHPVNPYSEEALQLPPEVTASSADLQISAADSARTGEPFTITATPTEGSFEDYRLQIRELNTWDGDELAYYTIYLRHSETPEFEYVFYDTGRFRIDVTGTRADETTAETTTFVDVTQGAAGTTVAEKVQEIVTECISVADTEYDRALWLHDWLTSNANYDRNFSIYGADGVLMRRTGVCDSYSKAYQLLLRGIGIETMRQTGQAGSDRHAWNLVKIEGNWCQVDCTWDDPNDGGYENHGYFGITDTMMARDHIWTGDYPTCDSLANYYYVRLGFTPVGSAEELDTFLSTAAAAQQETVKLCYIGPKANYSIKTAFSKWFYTNNWKYGLMSYQTGTENGEYTIEYGEPWEEPVAPDAADFCLQGLNGWHTLSQYNGSNGFVLVFGRSSDSSLSVLLNGLTDYWTSLWENGVDVLFNTIDQPTDARLREMESAYPGVFIGDGSSSLMWTYLRLCGYNQTSVSVPCVFYVNADGKVTDYFMGQVSDVEEFVQEALSLGTDNPVPPVLRHLDYSDYDTGCGSINGISGVTFIPAVQQAIQSGWVYLYINSQNGTNSPLAQYEDAWQLYSKLGIKMIVSFADGSDLSADFPHIQFVSFNDDDFWTMLRASGLYSPGGGSMGYLCGYLINPEGTILAAENRSNPKLDDCAGYIARNLQYNSTIPMTLTEIGAEAFADDEFTSVNLDNGSLQRIGTGAFANCDSLSFVCVPDSVTEVAEGVFQNCDDLLIVCTIGSAADRYAQDNEILHIYN